MFLPVVLLLADTCKSMTLFPCSLWTRLADEREMVAGVHLCYQWRRMAQHPRDESGLPDLVSWAGAVFAPYCICQILQLYDGPAFVIATVGEGGWPVMFGILCPGGNVWGERCGESQCFSVRWFMHEDGHNQVYRRVTCLLPSTCFISVGVMLTTTIYCIRMGNRVLYIINIYKWV